MTVTLAFLCAVGVFSFTSRASGWLGVATPGSLATLFGGMTLSAARNLGEQPTFEVSFAGVQLTIQTLLGKKQHHWNFAALLRIEPIQMGTNLFGRKIFDLRLLSRSLGPLHILSGRDEELIRAVADSLKRAIAATPNAGLIGGSNSKNI